MQETLPVENLCDQQTLDGYDIPPYERGDNAEIRRESFIHDVSEVALFAAAFDCDDQEPLPGL